MVCNGVCSLAFKGKRHMISFCWILSISLHSRPNISTDPPCSKQAESQNKHLDAVPFCLLSVSPKPLCLIFKYINIYGHSWAGQFSLCSQVMACESYVTVCYHNFIYYVTYKSKGTQWAYIYDPCLFIIS